MRQSVLHFRSAAFGSLALAVAMTARANTYRVDANAPSGDGSGWDQAINDLQTALDLAANNPGPDTIWVADGIYVPTELEDPNDVRSATFHLPVSDLEILGGYAGYGAEDPNLRDPDQFESVLSGIIPAPTPGPGYDNCPSEEGDCFVAHDPGLGCVDDYCCSKVCNSSASLGAICCDISGWEEACVNKALELCPTSLNAYHVVTGGALDDTVTLSGFTIRDGRADGNMGANAETSGGGMFVQYPDASQNRLGPNIVQCKFINNYALDDGGAAWHAGISQIGQAAHPQFINCQFIDNEAGGRGGAAYVGAVVEDTWVNCLFRDNTAGDDGGAAYEDHGTTPTEIVNCTFVSNTANDAGGGGSGGGIYSTDGTEIALTNCVVWLNTPDQLDLLDSGATVSYCDVEDWTGGGLNNITDNPNFINEATDDFRLKDDSPCMDVGNDAAIEDFPDEFDVNQDGDESEATPDLELKHRISNGPEPGDAVDMGAYEFFCPWDCDGSNDGNANVLDMLALLGQWDTTNLNPPSTCDGGGSCDYDQSGCVDVPDLLELLGHYAPPTAIGCPGQTSTDTLADALAEAGLTYPDDWNVLMAVLLDPESTEAERNLHLCWMNHYLDCHPLGWFCIEHYGPTCGGPDPWQGH